MIRYHTLRMYNKKIKAVKPHLKAEWGVVSSINFWYFLVRPILNCVTALIYKKMSKTTIYSTTIHFQSSSHDHYHWFFVIMCIITLFISLHICTAPQTIETCPHRNNPQHIFSSAFDILCTIRPLSSLFYRTCSFPTTQQTIRHTEDPSGIGAEERGVAIRTAERVVLDSMQVNTR